MWRRSQVKNKFLLKIFVDCLIFSWDFIISKNILSQTFSSTIIFIPYWLVVTFFLTEGVFLRNLLWQYMHYVEWHLSLLFRKQYSMTYSTIFQHVQCLLCLIALLGVQFILTIYTLVLNDTTVFISPSTDLHTTHSMFLSLHFYSIED